ncbi:GNAT family N-acetyltransferase [Actinoplanes philippinensis]|uniref:GNAT family N-acetyltransferase n=1 Tax=Actinoplanes philippinensis TaxID=35752 RepID=UPI0033EEC3C6
MDDSGSVRLRPVEAGDIEVFFAQQNDPGAQQRAGFPGRERDAFIEHWQRRVLGDPTGRARTIVVDGHVAGNIVAWWQDGRRLVGFWLGCEFWGRGLGTRALTAFIGAGQEETRPLYAEAAVHNVASIRALKRCGFDEIEVVQEGPDEFVVLKLG